MTKSKRINRTKAEYAALPKIALAALERQSMPAADLADHIGFKSVVVRTTLKRLQVAGQVHYVERRAHPGIGMVRVWTFGPEPLGHQATTRPALGCATDFRRIIRKTYPDRIAVRDPLISALYGPASLPASREPGKHSPTVDSAPATGIDLAPSSQKHQEVA